MYPKKKKFEIAGDFGTILNQSYISSQLIHAEATYFSSESSGFGLDVSIALNKDKSERDCVENFYNDYAKQAPQPCASDGDPATAASDIGGVDSVGDLPAPNMGPAYPNIREINYLISAFKVWNPIYGKQLFFMSGVVHFDLFLKFGGGVAMSNFYPIKEVSSTGQKYRGPAPEAGSSDLPPGVDVSDTDEFGINGRPEPESQVTPMGTVAVGQKFHLGKNFNIRMEIRNYTLVGTENIFETYFAVWGGVGIRL